MGNKVLKQKGQASLETAIAFVMVILLLAGIIKMWFWANNQIVQRQVRYNASRVAAGTAGDNYTLQWPVYQPPSLTEEEVLLDKK
jgi:uncharacterized protein (UPF0333 family)